MNTWDMPHALSRSWVQTSAAKNNFISSFFNPFPSDGEMCGMEWTMACNCGLARLDLEMPFTEIMVFSMLECLLYTI